MNKKNIGSLKAENEQAHCIQRMAQRFATILSPDDYRHICNMVKRNQSTCVLSESRTNEIHVLTYAGKDICVLYHNQRQTLVTVFTEQMVVGGYLVRDLIKKARTSAAPGVVGNLAGMPLAAAQMA